MSLPPPRRRIKVAPQYIGISIDSNKVVIPTDSKANEAKLCNWRQPIADRVNGTAEESSSDNDSEVHTSSDASTDESELETEEASDTDANGGAELTRRDAADQDGSIEPIGLEVEATDLVFETDFNSLSTEWTDNELKTSRKVIRLGKDVDNDGSISIWRATSEPSDAICSVSCLLDPNSDSGVISLYDLQRLIAFIAGHSIPDAKKKRLQKVLNERWHCRLINPQDTLYSRVLALKPPKPYVRRTAALWVVSWSHVEQILVGIFEAEKLCVTVIP